MRKVEDYDVKLERIHKRLVELMERLRIKRQQGLLITREELRKERSLTRQYRRLAEVG